jgi:tetratricopeptide (TPR) repeat protein
VRTLLGLLLLVLPVTGDVVVFESGGRLDCQVIEEAADTVTVQLPNGTMVLPRSRIVEIVREAPGLYLRREGQRSLRGGSTRDAVALLERAHATDPAARPDLVGALAARATELVGEFRHAAARAALARLAELEPGHSSLARLDARIRQAEGLAAALYERARKALDIRAYADALVLLEAWRVRRPLDDPQVKAEMAAAHLGAGRQAAEEGRLRRALDHYRAAVGYGARREADEPLYLLRPIAVLEALKQGDTGRAGRLLDGIETTYPQPAVPVFLAAVRHHVQGEVEEAVAAYARAARLAEDGHGAARGLTYDLVRKHAAATLRAAIARPPQEGVARWRELFLKPLTRDDGARYFTVYAASADRARELAELADRLYDRIAGDVLGGIPEAGKAEIVVHPTRAAYLAADPTPAGSPLASVTIPRSRTAGVCYRTLDEKQRPLVRVEMYATERVDEDTLPHEMVHVVQFRGFPAFRRGHWLDEGMAMLYESETGQSNRVALWRQLSKNPIPLPELLLLKSTPPDRVLTFYSEAYVFTRFLRGLGDDDAWRRFLAAFGGVSFEAAVQQAYGIENTAALERLWLGAGK